MAKTPEQIAARAAQLAEQERRRQEARQREEAARNARVAREAAERIRQQDIARAGIELGRAVAYGSDSEIAAASQRLAELGG